MSAVLTPSPTTPATPFVPPPPLVVPIPRRTIAELLHELGDIPAERVRLFPPPGSATEADAYWVNERDAAVELIDGTLVEKPVGIRADFIGTYLTMLLSNFVFPRRIGLVVTGRAQFRMTHGNLREPDVSFTRRERMPSPLPEIGGWCPDLCVEVLSPNNTKAEMAKKRAEYFPAGCRLVWEIDPEARTAVVYTAPDTSTELDENGVLDGGDVLPGFTLPLCNLFAELDAMDAPPTP
jgi:Uma2 family endonuclease